MSQNNKNQLKFRVGESSAKLFIEDCVPKLLQLGFTYSCNWYSGEVVLFYQRGDEIPFEVANHAKVLMEKYAPASGEEEAKPYHPIPFVPPNIKDGEELVNSDEQEHEDVGAVPQELLDDSNESVE